MKKTILWLTAAVTIAALFFTGCPTDPEPEPEQTVTSISMTPTTGSVAVDKTLQLSVKYFDADGNAVTVTGDTITWSSADDTKATVSNSGLVTGVAVTDSVTIKAESTKYPGKSATAAVKVTEAGVEPPPDDKLILITNDTSGGTMLAGLEGVIPTTALPTPVNNIYTIESRYAAGNINSSGGFVDTTFLYIDKPLTGKFKLRVRARMLEVPGASSTSKGMIIGGFGTHEETGKPGKLSRIAGIQYRTGGGAGVQPYAIRSVVSKVNNNEQAAVGGLNQFVNKNDEYIFEVIRTDTGYTTTVYISKDGTQFVTADVPYEGLDVQANTTLYPGIALMAVKADISQIQLWDGDIEGEVVFYSGDSVAAPVSVAGITVGVKDGEITTTGGTADNPATYIVKASDVTDGIQLETTTIPYYADNKIVNYFTSDDSRHPTSENISVNETTGLVSVIGAGEETIQVVTTDDSGAAYYLTITATEDYVPVGEFTITASRDSIQVGQQATFSTDISPMVTNPTVKWTASPADAVVFIDADNSEVSTFTGLTATIIGKKANANVTIKAEASTTGTTTTTKTAEKNIAVNTVTNAILNWQATPGQTLDFAEYIYMNADGTVAAEKGDTITWIARDGANNYTFDANGGFTMSGRRFNIGTAYTDNGGNGSSTLATTADANVTDGELDFSTRAAKVTVSYSSASDAAVLSLYVNNNTTSAGSSPLGSTSKMDATLTVTGGEAVYTIDPATFTDNTGKDSLATAFLQLRTASNNSIVITGITIEYVDSTGGVEPDSKVFFQWTKADVTEEFTIKGNTFSSVNDISWAAMNDIKVTTNGISMDGRRFVIGSKSSTATSTTVTDEAGELNLSKKFKITVDYENFTGENKFQIYINNNTTGEANSVLAKSRVVDVLPSTEGLTNPITVIIDPAEKFSNHASLANGFICIRGETSATMTVTGIKLEYVD